MEEMHKKLINDLQQQHQKQVTELLKEKDQLLQEETAATMAGKNVFINTRGYLIYYRIKISNSVMTCFI